MRGDGRPLLSPWFVLGALVALSGLLLPVACFLHSWHGAFGDYPHLHERLAAFRNLPSHSQELIAAIKQFQADKGRPPKDLHELVPEYLTAIPDTGVARFPTYEYQVFPEGGPGPFVWYDLGPADEKQPPGQPGQRPVGPPGRAVLLVRLVRAQEQVGDAQTERLAVAAGDQAFDPVLWRDDRLARRRMARSFVRDVHPHCKTKRELVESLGEPDGKGVSAERPWELRVPCVWGWGDPDRVIYWPTQDYGSLPRYSWIRYFPLGDWLYVRELF